MDPYTLCPCGSGKKLKFCCSDLIGEIEKIHRMIEGDQPRAALRHVEQTLAKRPGRASLLDLKAMLQMSLDEHDEAEATIQEFLKCEPDSPAAHAHHAMLLADKGETVEAVDALQAALERVETNLPQRVLEAIGAVGHALLMSGDVVAARAHLWLYEAIAGGNDHRALELLVRMNQMSGLPLLLRDRMALRGLPADHPVAAEIEVIRRMAAAGRWRASAAQLDELLPDHLDQPLFFYNRALLSGYLADRKNFAAGMRLYARQDIPADDAAEAEALAQLVDPELRDEAAHAVKLVFELKDEDALVERIAGSKLMQNMNLSPEELEGFEGPKPRGYYMLLDREIPEETESLTRDDVPHVLGFVAHFGRQTDRAERLELTTDRDAKFEKTIETLRAELGDAVGEQQDEVDLGEAQHGGDAALSWRWHLPPATSAQKRRELLREERQVALLERWPNTPRAALGGKTPLEAVGVEELQLPLLAAVLLLEQGSNNVGFGETFVELRKKLGLAQHETVPADQVDADTVPVVRVSRIDLAALSSAELAMLYKRCVLVNATDALGHILREALKRDDFDSSLPRPKLYEQLFTVEEDSEKAVAVLDEARTWAKSEGESCGHWDMLELQLHIAENNSEGANRVLTHLRDEHMDEPEIAQQIYQLLYMIGAIPPDAGMGGGAPGPAGIPSDIPAGAAAQMPSAPPNESAIWTPGGETESAGKSKLWTPD
ncbi:hypothetical protein NG895_19590 [Aeoliella sp. ICT_H6.2]|uniref:SEC-C motif-containing protein n=1 Tax=Aeoliella straminimaris TaxID=2954799 RepID=A0A9X2JKA0_9BACT|nr:hypothetical protein [Aeoliella straminimaris]MCO6046109.1 hypothetical protein [Aeoliella straminimaris]